MVGDVGAAPRLPDDQVTVPEVITGQRAKLVLLERVLDQLFGVCDVVLRTGPVPFDILGLPLRLHAEEAAELSR